MNKEKLKIENGELRIKKCSNFQLSTVNFQLLVFCLFFLTSCTPQNKSKLILNEDKDSYKIAVAAPQIGPYKALGLSIINGAELAVDIKNNEGGINGKKISLIKVDDGGLSGEGTWKARNLAEQMVLGVIGHLNSDISIPASEVYSKAKIAEITPGSTSPFFTEREPVRGYVFRTIGRDDYQGKLAADYAKKNEFKKVAVLYNNRSYGSSLASEFVKEIDKTIKHPEVIFYKTYSVDSSDFSKEISQLKQNPPDFIFFAGEYGDAAKFLTKLRSSGLKSVFLGSEGVFDEELIASAKTASEGALVISLPKIEDEKFIIKYKEKFGKDIGAYSANSFDATNILINAIEKTKSNDSAKVAKALLQTKDFPGLTGSLSFNEKGDLTNPNFTIYKIEKGKFETLN